MSENYYIYIMTNSHNTVLYTGITSNLQKRVYEHQNKLTKGFTERYNLHKLVYYEVASSPEIAIAREKNIKAGSRRKKIELIEQFNSDWKDLSLQLGF
ncbi:MAG: GIY-YIG nuclease family protein [Deltaproteobacteria bacterium]|nr:GIY-YIG nuclease family protein [Deltaproteobacteria bacterium]